MATSHHANGAPFMRTESDIETAKNKMPSSTTRVILSCLIIGYLFLVLLGPLSNPVASANLTGPLAKKLRPLHQAIFIGHGYRFFGPDPGPSHILEYQIRTDEGTEIVGRFPDRDVHWPRLRYHRWFMLSETVYQDRASLPEPRDYQQLIQQLDSEIQDLRLRGEIATMYHMIRERDLQSKDYQSTKVRTELLLRDIARFLLREHQGQSIELILRERLIARPVDIDSHIKLNDPRFLSEPRSVAKFTSDELLNREEVE